MNRPVLIVASILLFGCGAPFHLLIHNELSSDEEITISWFQTSHEESIRQEETVLVRKGRAEDAVLWYGAPDRKGGIGFGWDDANGAHRHRVPMESIPRDAYHAYVSADGVRFARRDWMDNVHERLTGLNAPMWWCCILTTLFPGLVLLVRRARARRAETRPSAWNPKTSEGPPDR